MRDWLRDAHAELLGVHAGDAEHQRGRLHAALLVALFARDAGAVGDIRIASAIDDDLAQHGLAAAFALGDDAADRVAVHHDTRAGQMERHVHLGLEEHLQRDVLHRLRLDERDAHVQRAPAMLAGAVHQAQPVDEFLRQTLDDLVFLLAEETKHRQSDGHVAADEAAALDQPDVEPVLGSGERGDESGRAAADDEHVVFGADGTVRAGS